MKVHSFITEVPPLIILAQFPFLHFLSATRLVSSQ